jgi:hypothetical protein
MGREPWAAAVQHAGDHPPQHPQQVAPADGSGCIVSRFRGPQAIEARSTSAWRRGSAWPRKSRTEGDGLVALRATVWSQLSQRVLSAINSPYAAGYRKATTGQVSGPAAAGCRGRWEGSADGSWEGSPPRCEVRCEGTEGGQAGVSGRRWLPRLAVASVSGGDGESQIDEPLRSPEVLRVLGYGQPVAASLMPASWQIRRTTSAG